MRGYLVCSKHGGSIWKCKCQLPPGLLRDGYKGWLEEQKKKHER